MWKTPITGNIERIFKRALLISVRKLSHTKKNQNLKLVNNDY